MAMKTSSGSIPHPSKIAPFSIPPIIHDLIEFIEEYGKYCRAKRISPIQFVINYFLFLFNSKFAVTRNISFVGVQTEGIFRINGRSEDIAAIKKHYKKGKLTESIRSNRLVSNA